MDMIVVDGVRYRPEDAPKDREQPKAKARTSSRTRNKKSEPANTEKPAQPPAEDGEGGDS